jgi:hypothetical protein
MGNIGVINVTSGKRKNISISIEKEIFSVAAENVEKMNYTNVDIAKIQALHVDVDLEY